MHDPVADIAQWPVSQGVDQAPTSAPLCLKFGGEIAGPVRSRVSYAFKVFAAIYGHTVVDADSGQEATCCLYGENPRTERGSHTFSIPARYRARSADLPAPRLLKYSYAGEELYLFFGLDQITGNPDWLGELFEWISSSHERSVKRRDSVGRIPYSETVFSRDDISPRKPYATLVMAWMENSLRNGGASQGLPKAPSPVPGVDHSVVCTQDIDFHYTGRRSALLRLLKNLGVASRPYRSLPFFWSNVRMILHLLRGKRVGDYLPLLLQAGRTHEFASTIFVVSRRNHRRDPNYRLADVLSHLHNAREAGFSLGLHGSYTSVIELHDLDGEAAALQQAIGVRPLANRQHWLRFDNHEILFDAVERANLVFDSTLGFAETVGFRNGASFAFPPYDFRNERPHSFLEIPLALMDGNLEAASRCSGENAKRIADEILGASRKWGWGGIATLWHNPFEPIQVPDEINQVFWSCVMNQKLFDERWMSASQFLGHALARYQDAGLLQGVRIDA
jgi:hypothetical protein